MTVDEDEAKGVIAKDERRANNKRSDTKWNLLPSDSAIETHKGTSTTLVRPTNFVSRFVPVVRHAAATSMQS